ncbi:MAG: PD-(D/E)XK nuclease family transposase [Cyanobacteria bacterium J06626_6]
MAFPLQERYVNLLTDFGFKRVFGSEPNKQLLVDFLNTLLPAHHQIQELSYKSTENLGKPILIARPSSTFTVRAQMGSASS